MRKQEIEETRAYKLAYRFFEIRFPKRVYDRDTPSNYFMEWVDRFNTAKPSVYMDSESLKAYSQLLEELKEK